MKKIQISLNAMEAKVYELCKSATKGSDNGAMFCFDEVAVPAKKELGLSQDEVKGYLGSLKKKDAIRKLHESYYDFFVPEKCEDDYDWPYLDELYTVEIKVEGAAKPAPSAKKHLKIYQLPVENNAKFMDLEFVTEHNIMPKLEDYKLVWEGEVEDCESLDSIYTKFNLAHPKGFKGHSLSMSDVVFMDGKYFYCESFGWEDVTEMFPKPKLKKGEKYECVADYVLEDGVIAYKAGKTYEMVSDVCLLDEDGCDLHKMSDERDFYLYFRKVEKKAYIVKAYGSCYYKSKYNTREEALAEADKLNEDYYQRKIWNVEEVIDEEAA